ncbi:TetR/AcrR family transcriptional regulator [Streptomyces sp. NPDC051286]|uniref:TetR/AcrR family transcriptional regulator n=1 Tax=Streptomyces sp. NPDC051286 TaxID=3365647 RepID=UPI0037AF397A
MASNDRRERVLASALELIARDGFDGVRMTDIAAHAGVSAALVHYHFASRTQLLTEALAQSLSAAEARMERVTADAHRQTATERMADLIDFCLPLTPEDVRESCLWDELELRAVGSDELSRTLATLLGRILRPFEEAVAAGLEEGVFHNCQPEEVAAVALALLSGLSTRVISNDPALPLARARDLAGKHVALAVGYAGTFPFRELPPTAPTSPRPRREAEPADGRPAIVRRRRAPGATQRP